MSLHPGPHQLADERQVVARFSDTGEWPRGAVNMPGPVGVVDLGGSMRVGSASLTALQTALDGAATAAALPRLFWVRDLDLSMHSPERAVPAAARSFGDSACASEAMI
jgi:hypothetical protein